MCGRGGHTHSVLGFAIFAMFLMTIKHLKYQYQYNELKEREIGREKLKEKDDMDPWKKAMQSN